VTGAGRGIGRAYAHLLAARGASVVVNDLGGTIDGRGADREPAAAVVAEIVDAGGVALADGNDVADEQGAGALIEAALERFGRVDALINNAGIMRWARFPDVAAEDFDRHLAVHARASFLTARAAWPHMVDQRYGRIVMTTSSGMLGLANNTSYATAKAGVIGLTRSLAVAGAAHGIAANLVAPAAFTRMAGPATDESMPVQMAPELVAPLVAYLAHEACPVSGEMYAAGAGRFARMFLASTPGYVQTGSPTVEDIATHWTEINDEAGYTVPRDLVDWSAAFTEHLR
jgi:NAD(P)-dependent dehydrogenase (short-subunit alcohol dehydrogenase family)